MTVPSLAPLLNRITRSFWDIVCCGWRPPRECDDMVLWHRRDWNIRADHLVNFTMDERKSWYQCFPFEPADLERCNLTIHTDGGTRANSCSAAAWCIEAVVRRGQYETTTTLMIAGTNIATPISSFTAEALALEEAALAVTKITRQHSQQHSHFKLDRLDRPTQSVF